MHVASDMKMKFPKKMNTHIIIITEKNNVNEKIFSKIGKKVCVDMGGIKKGVEWQNIMG